MSRTQTWETHDAEQKIRTASETNWEIVLRNVCCKQETARKEKDESTSIILHWKSRMNS
jgi:hypothetical protein